MKLRVIFVALFALVSASALAVLQRGTPTTTTFYFSPSGSDSDNCLSTATACQTITKLNSLTYTHGNRILLQGGQTFTGCISLSPSNVTRSLGSDPIIIGSYGMGYFQLNANCGSTSTRTAAITVDRLSGITVQDCILRVAPASAGTVAIGVWLQNTASTEITDLTVQRCEPADSIRRRETDAATTGAHVFVTTSAFGGGLRRVSVLDNIMHGVSQTSNDLAGVQGFAFGSNIFDAVYRGNHVWNMGTQDVMNNHASGILANGVTGGTIEYNLVHDIGANWTKCGGPVGIWAHGSTNVTIQYNEAFRVRPLPSWSAGCDWSGIGLDSGGGPVTNSTVQYNWSHDNGGSGIYHHGGGASGNNTIRFNVTANNNQNNLTTFGELSFNGSNNVTTGLVYVYNNTLYATPSGTQQKAAVVFQGLSAGMPQAGSVIANNIVSQGSGQFGLAVMLNANQNTPTPTWANNLWHARAGTIRWNNWTGATNYSSYATWQAVSRETGGVTSDPTLVAGGTTPTIGAYSPPEPTGYSLQSGSPAIGAGGDLNTAFSINAGSHDYYGTAIPHGTGSVFNIGAWGGASSGPHITLSSSFVKTGSAQGTKVGMLSITNSPGGTFTYSVTNTAMGRIQVSGSALEAGPTATNFTNMALLLIKVEATNGTLTLQRYFVITVNDV
jgi:hypothetical protein